ncbi:PP2C family protein-serine/threonine phosphatase [Streptomyces sp. JV185]|uniref:PP2C family protein-serine/threonine phosphatase n=1 Tax=Streptomyces sp. JV185 TaxID=858638 RepID=UPI002E7A86CF|nr:PP2C family protein-serine/threonine phosphatase [Streptomyces sp. JV185]
MITAADIATGPNIALGPLLVVAPALTAWFAGPWTTAGIGVLAMAGEVINGWYAGRLSSRNVVVEVVAIAVITSLIVALCAVRDRRAHQMARVRSVADAAQQVVMWPLPRRLGPLRLACVYLAAEEEADIGGDLYAAVRTGSAVRVMIGDVRGKGLPALGEAALLLGAFREAAHQQASLPDLAASLERSMTRYLADFEPEGEAGERFVTALLVEIADAEPLVRMISCGHPAPLLLGPDNTVHVPRLHPGPPLGVGVTDPDSHVVDVLPFGPEDTLVLYTDGVIEARDHNGVFYPFAERAAQWTDHLPEALLQHIERDLIAYAGGRLGDDVALLAIRRAHSSHDEVEEDEHVQRYERNAEPSPEGTGALRAPRSRFRSRSLLVPRASALVPRSPGRR